MEEQVKIEQDLSEEQLQEITGGCATCEAEMNVVKAKQGLVEAFHASADVALKQGDIPAVANHLSSAATLIQANDVILNRVARRGHQ